MFSSVALALSLTFVFALEQLCQQSHHQAEAYCAFACDNEDTRERDCKWWNVKNKLFEAALFPFDTLFKL